MHKEIVQLYINQFHKSLPNKIYQLICLLCDYMGSGIIVDDMNEISYSSGTLGHMTSAAAATLNMTSFDDDIAMRMARWKG